MGSNEPRADIGRLWKSMSKARENQRKSKTNKITEKVKIIGKSIQ